MREDKLRFVFGHKRTVIVFLCCIILAMVFLFGKEEKQDNSFLQMNEIAWPMEVERSRKAAKRPLGVSDGHEVKEVKAMPPRQWQPPIKYRANQVIMRPGGHLPIGSKISGRLLAPLDTRHPGKMVKAILSVAASFRGEVALPAKTLLFGRLNYGGSGQRIDVQFDRGLTPNGMEFDFAGRSYIDGDYQSAARGRIAKSMGLTAISNMANVLTQKEALGSGKGMVINRKSTLPNALLYAAEEASRKEAKRQVERIGESKDYVTVKAGSLLVIHLTTTFKGVTNE